MQTDRKYLIVVAGATASGKTALAIALAQHYGTVIFSADSRQLYREMDIGTAKPSPDELAAVPHHFINHLSVHQTYSVGDFEREAIAALTHHFATHKVAIMVGGTGLYLKAVCDGLDEFPPIPPHHRQALMQQWASEGIESLQTELATRDPAYFATADTANPHRLIRALEVCRHTGQPFSAFRTAPVLVRPFEVVKIAIDHPRAALYDRINRRVESMVAQGLAAEARSLYPLRYLNALQTVGYQEFFDYFDHKFTLETTIALIQQNTRRYAKRQLTWFRKDPALHWFAPDALHQVIPFVEKIMRESLPSGTSTR